MASIGLAWAQATKMYEDEVKQKELNSRLKAERKLFDAQLEANIKQAEYMKAVNEPKFRIGTIVANNQDKILAGDPTATANVYSAMINDSTKMVTVDPTDSRFVNVVDKATGKVQSRLPVLSGTTGLAYATNLSRNMLEQTIRTEAEADATLAFNRTLMTEDRKGEWDIKKIGAQGKNQLAAVGASNAGAMARLIKQGEIEEASTNQKFWQDLAKYGIQQQYVSDAAEAKSAADLKQANVEAQTEFFKTVMQNPDALPKLITTLVGSSVGTPLMHNPKTGSMEIAIPGFETMSPAQQNQITAAGNTAYGAAFNQLGLGFLGNIYNAINVNRPDIAELTGGIDYSALNTPLSFSYPQSADLGLTPWAKPTAQPTAPVTSIPSAFYGTQIAPRQWGGNTASPNAFK